MSTTLTREKSTAAAPRQFATFFVGHMLLGVDIHIVQEINRQSEITKVPHAPRYVRGVINLRGEVATVVDLRTILGLSETEISSQSRNLIVHHQGEAIGLLVDRVSDILTLDEDQISPPPANIDGIDARLIRGVAALPSRIAMILDVDAVLSDHDSNPANVSHSNCSGAI